MSALEYNLVCGGGDGIKSSIEKPSAKRTPIPSARKLGTRPQHRANNENVKRKLQESLNQLATPSPRRKFCRKRSQTVAEITPSKRKTVNDNKLSTDFVGVGRKSPHPLRKEDASRRVYNQLLLNAWRRRRVQVATLTDSSRRLQTQVDQLQMQVDVLQKLRESESQRRLESANEAEHLRQEVDSLRQSIENLHQDRKCLEIQLSNLQQRVEDLTASRTNIKNELLTTKGELSLCEHKLENAHKNEMILKEENQNLLDKISEYQNTTLEQIQTIHRLELDLELVEKNLDTANLNNSNLEESKIELETKLEKEKDNRGDLEQQYIKTRAREEKLEKKIQELKRIRNVLKDAKRKIVQDNFVLKRTLEELEMSLKEEKDKKWWKYTTNFMLNTIHNVAYMMLPIYTDVVDYTTIDNVEEQIKDL